MRDSEWAAITASDTVSQLWLLRARLFKNDTNMRISLEL